MAERNILITGASSEVGIKTINAIQKDYNLIYAHYGHSNTELLRVQKKIGDKVVLVQDDFCNENAGKEIVRVIQDYGKFPEHIIHLTAPVVEGKRFSKIEWSDFENNINISVRSCVNILQPILKELFKQKKQGRVIFMLTSYTENIPPHIKMMLGEIFEGLEG